MTKDGERLTFICVYKSSKIDSIQLDVRTEP